MEKIDLKKKLGPLPIWGWAALGTGTLGVVYFLHRSSSTSSTAATQTDANLAAEQAAAGNAAGTGYYGDSGSAGAASAAPAAGVGYATGVTTTDDLASELAGIQEQIAAYSVPAATDPTPSSTITSEAADLVAAQAALAQLGLGGTPTPTTGGTAAAKGKSAAGLPILTQLEDLQKGLVTKAQLGPGAAAALATTKGNVAKAIAARETPLKKAAAKPTTHKTTTPAKKKAA